MVPVYVSQVRHTTWYYQVGPTLIRYQTEIDQSCERLNDHTVLITVAYCCTNSLSFASMNRTNHTNDPIWYLIRIGGSNSTNSIAFQPFSRFSRFGRFGRFLQFCLILEIPLSYRRKKYPDKIRSAEGTDPMFCMYLVLVVLVVDPILIGDTSTG